MHGCSVSSATDPSPTSGAFASSSTRPYIFAALKIGATASVVGALIGELPSSIPNGLGAQIINFSQYYSTEPRGLWATNLIAAALGISFFLVIVVVEKLVVRRAPENLV